VRRPFKFASLDTVVVVVVFCFKEGSWIITGLSYKGKTPEGKLNWDGLRNVKLSIYELSYTYQVI